MANDVASPDTEQTSPRMTPPTAVARNEPASCWAAATGTIMIALTRRSPTVRMPMTTVTAARTVSRMPSRVVLIPCTWATSGSSVMAKNSRPKSARMTRTRTLAATSHSTSSVATVDSEPKRYWLSAVVPLPEARDVSRTPAAMPP